MTGGWRKLHSEELHNLCPSPDTLRTMKSKMMRWVGYAARKVRQKLCTKLFMECLKGRDHSAYLDVEGRIILKLILVK
jgi:hypothetical protein